MRKVLKGKDFMVFVDGKAVALATNHQLTLNIDTTSTASKDSGLWDESEVTGFNWEASSESLGAPDDGTPVDISYETLMDKALAAEKVPIIAGIPKTRILMESLRKDGQLRMALRILTTREKP